MTEDNLESLSLQVFIRRRSTRLENMDLEHFSVTTMFGHSNHIL
uniref:Uncharacterized protein n=1 Tax=Arundo donax TaxID=35708 RepID=A0A0A9TW46_ARUDO